MTKLIITMYYETEGKKKVLEFSPVSRSGVKNSKNISFGLPKRVQRIVERKSFKLVEIPCKHYDGLRLQYVGMGQSVDKTNLFFHFKPF